MTWARVNLGDIAEFKNGLNFNKDQYGQGVKYISVADFQDYFSVKTEGLAELKEDFINASYFLKKGDILFVRSNGNKELVGRNLFIENTLEPLTFSGFCIRARFTKEDVLPKFYAYLFKSKFFRNTLSANAGGTNINNLNQGILSNLNIPKPPLSTQYKITNILSAYDDLIENNLRRVKLLEEEINIKYKNIISKESDEFSNVKLNSFVDIISGYPFKSNYYNENGKYKIVTIKNVQDGFFVPIVTDKIDEIPDRMNSGLFLNTGDVIMSLTGNVGRVCLVYGDNYVLNQRVVKLAAKDINDLGFVYALLRDKQMQTVLENLSNGTAQQNLSPIKMGELFIKYPFEKSRKVFNEIALPMIDLICKINLQNTKLREARDILLPKLMNGQIEI